MGVDAVVHREGESGSVVFHQPLRNSDSRLQTQEREFGGCTHVVGDGEVGGQVFPQGVNETPHLHEIPLHQTGVEMDLVLLHHECVFEADGEVLGDRHVGVDHVLAGYPDGADDVVEIRVHGGLIDHPVVQTASASCEGDGAEEVLQDRASVHGHVETDRRLDVSVLQLGDEAEREAGTVVPPVELSGEGVGGDDRHRLGGGQDHRLGRGRSDGDDEGEDDEQHDDTTVQKAHAIPPRGCTAWL